MNEEEAQPDSNCAVCGRGLLPGERPSRFVNDLGVEVVVCELCKPRAEASGWLRPEEAAVSGASTERGRRRQRGSLLGGGTLLSNLLARRPSGAGAGTRPESPADADAPAEAPAEERASEREPVAAERRPAAPAEQRPAAPTRRRRAPAASPEAESAPSPSPPSVPPAAAEKPPTPPARPVMVGPTLEQAVEVFNASEARRMVGGLNRSLGQPRASGLAIKTSEGHRGARITVVWELAWYQWEVGPAKKGAAIRQSAKGDSPDELRAADRTWNMSVAEDGELAQKRRSEPEG